MSSSVLVKASYKFQQNILKLSRSDKLDEVVHEWDYLTELNYETKTVLCICGHLCQNVEIRRNRYTNEYIYLGTDCRKKFNFNTKLSKNKYIKLLFTKINNKDIYKHIDDIKKYSKEVEERYVAILKNIHLNSKQNKKELCILRSALEDLIENYNYEFLENLLQSVLESIKKIEDAEFKREQEFKITQAKEKAEREKEKAELEEQYKIRQAKEKAEREEQYKIKIAQEQAEMEARQREIDKEQAEITKIQIKWEEKQHKLNEKRRMKKN